MIFLYAFLLLLVLYKVKLVEYNSEYASKETTLIIKGIFVILVFFRHFSEYITGHNLSVQSFLIITKIIGQLMVGGFLYYSGYGMMESYKMKGIAYINRIPRHNILKLFLNFGCAVVIFLVFDLIIGRYYPLKTILLSFTAWTNIGNSNWYIFACFAAYFEFFITIKLFHNNMCKAFLAMVIGAVAYTFFVLYFKEEYWCSTYFCFFLGVFYSWKKDIFEKFIKVNKNYFHILCVTFICLFLTTVLRYQALLIYIFSSVYFCLFITLLTMKVSLYSQNKVLKWLGIHTFSIYILQRIPMIMFSVCIPIESEILFFFLTFLMTCLLSIWFDKIINKLDLLFILK